MGGGTLWYLVKWVGYDHCEDKWLRLSELGNCSELVRAYDAAHPV
jgi:Chromo (CHRromatin Organisation MOdifier) domain